MSRRFLPYLVVALVLFVGPWLLMLGPGSTDAQGTGSLATYISYVTWPLGLVILIYGSVKAR